MRAAYDLETAYDLLKLLTTLRSLTPFLEREPHARGQRVGILRGFVPKEVGVAGRGAVGALGGVERAPREQVAPRNIEGGIRGKAPGHPEIRLGPDIAGIS